MGSANSTKKTSGIRVAFLASVSGLAMGAFAGDAGAAGPIVALEEIKVTARKIEENMQRVPVSLSAITGRALDMGYVNDLSDVAAIAPNVIIDPTIGFSNAASISIRGISFQDVEKSFDPAVGVVIDGVYLATSSQALLDNFDIERIEVLRGPQGTLFGKNTTGGTVNVIRKRPGREMAFDASASYGNMDSLNLKAAADLPISSDKAFLRLAANWKRSDGYLTNTANGEKLSGDDVFSLRGALLFDFGNDWQAYLNYDHISDRSDSVGLRNATMPTQMFSVPGLLGINPLFPGFPADEGPLDEVRSDFPNSAKYTTNAVSLEVTRNSDAYTLTSITAYRDVNEKVYFDFDAENASNFNSIRTQNHSQFTQEIRLASHWSDTYSFVAGAYYFWSEYDLLQQIDVLTDWVPCGVLPFPYTSLGCSQSGVADQTTNSYAGFVQGNVNLTEDLRFTLGGRYTDEKKSFGITPIVWPPGALGSIRDKEDWSEFTWRTSLDYQATDTVFLFASYATGFKSGGFNGRAQTITSIGPYDPEKVRTFEVGIKTEWADRRVRLNITGFHNRYRDMQVELLRTAVGGTGQETVVENAASAKTQGIEIELQAVPTEGLSINANLGILDAEYKDFTADLGLGLGVTDNTALDLRRAPKVEYAIGATYAHPVGDAGQLVLDASYSWRDDLHTTTQNLELGHRRSVGILNGSIGFEDADGMWDISLYGRNLTDEVYIADGLAIGALVSVQTISPPRQWGVQVGVHF